MNKYPEYIENEEQLNELLSRPDQEVIDLMKTLDGDILFLGIAGKMGPTIADMAIRACKEAGIEKTIYGVSRFSKPGSRDALEKIGVKTIACDLMDQEKVQDLPKVKNVIFMAGRKFGVVGTETLTWMMNTIVPYHVASAFKESRIVVFSTGCVYSLETPESGGSSEKDIPVPVGEYANSCLGRERVFDHYSRTAGTEMLFYRLNYAIDLRYGVLVDIAQKILDDKPISLSADHANIIWQGDASNRALLCLKHVNSPGMPLNITGPECLSVKELATKLGEYLGKQVKFEGKPAGRCYLNNASKSFDLFGQPKVKPEQMIRWVAHWLKKEGSTLDNPTHFEVTDGQFLDEEK